MPCSFPCCFAVLFLVSLCCDCLPANDESDVNSVLSEFREQWPDDRVSYRNADDDESWKTYALSMRRLVAMGDGAVVGMIEACDDRSFQVRALAARVLGYLQAKASVPKLVELLGDDNATVALQAADALGQIHDPAGLDALQVARSNEKRGDVLLHINKSLDRTVALEADVVQQILSIDKETIDSAKVGQAAPDFTLKEPDGQSWKLSDIQGKKSVVLVFIYGDG